MSKSYQQLSEEERIEIYTLKREEKSVLKIAKALKRNPTTMYWSSQDEATVKPLNLQCIYSEKDAQIHDGHVGHL